MRQNKLRVICFGMGAIGTYIGGSLAAKGAEVVFIEKKEMVSGASERGIRLMTEKSEIRIPIIEVFSDIKQVIGSRPFDVALLAVKSFDTKSVLDSITGIEDQFPPILCLQNGVENEDLIAQKIGSDKVISGTITSAVGRSGLGDVKLEKLRGVGIETGNPLSKMLIDWFNLAGLRAKGYTSRANMKWSKMTTNLLANASSAILNWTPRQIFSDPLMYRLEVTQIRETLAVMKALGLDVVDLPGTPVVLLMRLINSLPSDLSSKIVGIPLARARGAKMPSFHIDLYAGKTISEVTYLNGAVTRFGKSAGVATPVNQVLSDTLEQLASGRLTKDMFNNQPEKLHQLIKGVL
ncbi:MAG: 2-dehydropantoate 2-reductase [Chloroflexi bacterium]|nr:MAG: 2-dehydropantoate 2-reductase [Chloroflexota bacterium]